MSDKQCAKYVDGVAVHWYWDFLVPVKVLNDVHNDFSDKIIMNTEASQGMEPQQLIYKINKNVLKNISVQFN